MMRVLVILVFGIHLTSAATHTLQYFYTATTGISNYPRFVDVGIVNGELISMYDSTIQRKVPKQNWMAENLDQQYWDSSTEIMKGTETVFFNNIQVAMSRFNQTTGVHSFQFMYGCERDDDGTARGYYEFGYDGDDFISFDKNTLTNTAANPQAVITKIKWDADKAKSEYRKTYLEKECIEWLNKYVSYGKNSLERKVAPEVSLLQQDSSSPVTCHATGFYPNNIMMTWKKNNEDHNEDVEVSSTLPNDDGTFQKSISLSVKSEEWKKNPDVYRCVIQHVGADKEIVVILNEKNIKTNSASNNIIAIVAICVVALAVLAAIIGLVVWKVKSKGYKKAGSHDSDSENSDQPLPKA